MVIYILVTEDISHQEIIKSSSSTIISPKYDLYIYIMDQHEIKHEAIPNSIEDKPKIDNRWTWCCTRMTPEQVKYMTQVGFGASLMIFCMAKILSGDGTDDKVWVATLTGTAAVFFPNPSMKP